MTQRLTQEQLAQIVTEVGGLQVRRNAELDQQQIREILQELLVQAGVKVRAYTFPFYRTTSNLFL